VLTKGQALRNARRDTFGPPNVRKVRKAIIGGNVLGIRNRLIVLLIIVIIVQYTPDLALM
jgi:hypothetical protein